MPNKPKTTQPKTENEVQGRDLFQTPNYATDLLIPFLKNNNFNYIWECAAGEGKISDRLMNSGFHVTPTDIRFPEKNNIFNFITDTINGDEDDEFMRMVLNKVNCIVTNPPFSLKYKFINKAIEYDIPSAFLIPFDMCQSMAKLFKYHHCQGIVPMRRIDYITPTGKSGATGHSSYYHSFWLTYKFNLKDTLVFVDLANETKKENI